MLKSISVFVFFVFVNITNIYAQYSREEIKNKPCFVGSSAFMIMNVFPDKRPNFIQLNLGYRITPKDAISLEVKTWRYFEPLGIPYGDARADANEKFPGFIREKGFALVYQRFLWKGLYASIHLMSAWQDFMNKNKQKIDNGFQIFNTYRLGYHIKLFKGNFFVEPSIAVTHRPYHTKMPTEFKKMDDKWSKFFFGEPGLHFGVNF